MGAILKANLGVTAKLNDVNLIESQTFHFFHVERLIVIGDLAVCNIYYLFYGITVKYKLV